MSSASPDNADSPDSPPADDDGTQKPSEGPSLLSRDFGGSLGAPQFTLTPTVEISGVYDSGLSGVVVGPGSTKNVAAFGMQYSLGLRGVHSWRYTRLSLNYGGSTARYFGIGKNQNSSQSLSLGIVHTLNAHTTLNVNGAGSIYSRAFAQTGVSSGYVPALDVSGNRASSFSTQIALTIQKSARLSFSLAGNGGLSHQSSSVVYDVGSVGAVGDIEYRLGPRSTVGVSYTFSSYIYPGSTSSTDYHNVSGNFAVTLSRRTQVSFSACFLRAESLYLEAFPTNPLLAYLTGALETVVVNYHVSHHPSGGGRIMRSFSRGSASLSGGYSVVPGNGLFLATVATNVSGSCSYTGIRNWNLSAGGSYSVGKSIGTSLGRYGTMGGTFSVTRPLTRFTQAVMSFSTTKYESAGVAYYNRLMYQVRIGLGFSPSGISLGSR